MAKVPRPSPASHDDVKDDVEAVFRLLDEIRTIQPQDEETALTLASRYEALGDCYRGLRMFGRCMAMYECSLQVDDSPGVRVKLAELLVHLLGPAGFSQAQQLVGATVDEDHTTPAAAIARRIKQKQDAVDRAQELAALRGQHPPLQALVGQSAHLLGVYEQILRYAPTPRPVLITGPTGSGKEVVAHALHACSPRAKRPPIVVNCVGIPDSLFESAMFGHKRGAFTGADRDHVGYVEAAHQGTLFLDEVSKLPRSSQAKLLRVLESGDYYRVGDSQARRADLRLLAATNQDLAQLVKTGDFREDLLDRLRVLEIPLSPLDDRLDDLLPLARHFLAKSQLASDGTAFSDADLLDWVRLQYLVHQRLEAADAWSIRVFEHAVYRDLADGKLQPRGDRPFEDVLRVRVHSARRESLGPTVYTAQQLDDYDLDIATTLCPQPSNAARLLDVSPSALSNRRRRRASRRSR